MSSPITKDDWLAQAESAIALNHAIEETDLTAQDCWDFWAKALDNENEVINLCPGCAVNPDTCTAHGVISPYKELTCQDCGKSFDDRQPYSHVTPTMTRCAQCCAAFAGAPTNAL